MTAGWAWRISRRSVPCRPRGRNLYLDGHQRVSPGCFDRCAQVSVERGAIVSPDIKDYGLLRWRLHGAEFQCVRKTDIFRQHGGNGFSARCFRGRRVVLRRISSEAMYADVAWSSSLQGWGLRGGDRREVIFHGHPDPALFRTTVAPSISKAFPVRDHLGRGGTTRPLSLASVSTRRPGYGIGCAQSSSRI